MSNRLFQSVIYQMKDAAHRVFGVIDENGMVIACSDLTKIGELRMGLREEFAFHAGAVAKDGYSYRTIGSGARAEYAVFVEGESEQEQELASVVAVALNNLKGLFEDRYDRNLLIKNILLDNILPGDVYIKAKQLRFETDVPRAVFVIRFHGRNEMVPYDMVANLFPDKKKDCIISIGTSDIVLVPGYARGGNRYRAAGEARLRDCGYAGGGVLRAGVGRHRSGGGEYQGPCEIL